MRLLRPGYAYGVSIVVYSLIAAICGIGAEPAPSAVSAIEQKKIIAAAQQYAGALAGKDDTSAKYYQLFQHAIRGATNGRQETMSPIDHARSARGEAMESQQHLLPAIAKTRAAFMAQEAAQGSIFTDPTWLQNEAKRRARAIVTDPGRIFGGRQTMVGELRDCVAVQGGVCLCTGTLIGPNVVITAGHCNADGCVSRIVVGNDVNQAVKTVNVKKAIPHPDFDAQTLKNDLTVLILAADITDVAPRPIAQGSEIDGADSVQLAGFGLTEFGATGRKFVIEVAIARTLCVASDSGGYGCFPDLELVAGGNGHDSCNGDSGGPAYVMTSAGLKLAGATSRAVKNAAVNCGDGGIYVRIDRYLDWIRTTVQENGGTLP